MTQKRRKREEITTIYKRILPPLTSREPCQEKLLFIFPPLEGNNEKINLEE